MGVGGQRHAPVFYPRELHIAHCAGGWVGRRALVDGAEKLSSTGIRSPDRPARSETPCRLSYPGSNLQWRGLYIMVY